MIQPGSAIQPGGGVPEPIKNRTIQAKDGSAAAPAISFSSDPDTGIYRKTTNSIGIATGGAEKFYIDTAIRGGNGIQQYWNGDGNWGAYGVIAGTHRSNSNPAASGTFRDKNNSGLVARNAANTADLPLIKANAGDRTEIGGQVDLADGALGGATVTHDDYLIIYVGGVAKKVMLGS